MTTPRYQPLFVAQTSNVVPFPKAQKWFDFRNVKEESADLFIYDVVGDSWVGTDAVTLVKEIKAQKGKAINVHLNSPGGSVFDGYAIFNALKAHDGVVTTFIDGMAASIASIIALAGSKVVIASNGMMMIHNPLCYCFGTATEIRKQADVLDQIRETLINTYVTRTGKTREVVGAAMDEETYFTASEAKAYGLVDEISGSVKVAACISQDIVNAFGWQKTPKALLNTSSPIFQSTPRSILSKKLALREHTN
jgi:ATP-dependent Clp endopeptidase proteolytic subunit ClpP